jgi:DNA helicase HerA-like ATPase
MIGHIDGSVPATTQTFDIVLAEGASVELDDLVVTRQPHAGPTDGVAHYGIVTECSSQIEGAQFSTDTQRIAGARTMPGVIAQTATVRVLRADPEVWIPPCAGAPVERATGVDRERALFVDQMDDRARLPIGFDRRLEPVYVDFTFLNGEKGGHVSISGVSGVATKTSYALFLLYQLFETKTGARLLGAHRPNTRALVFNVKGEDLLHLDRANARFDAHLDAVAQWRSVGVARPGVFTDVAFYAPVSARAGANSRATDVQTRAHTDLHVFGWTPLEFIRRGLLRFAFADPADTRNQVAFVEENVRLQLLRWAHPSTRGDGSVVMIDPALENIPRNWDRALDRRRTPRDPGDGVAISTFAELVELIDAHLESEDVEWTGRTAVGTVNAFQRRLHAVSRRLGHMMQAGVESFELSRSVNVVDLHALHDDGQRFVVGALLAEIFEQKQGTGREPLRFIVLDELNKYAPREGQSPIKELLIDVAARGRSLGVILIGAQQSAATVAPTIVENAAIKIVGRLDASASDAYKFLGPELRERTTRFLPGTMVVDQPLVPAPIPLRFPFPSYATNVADDASRAQTNLDPAYLNALSDEIR